MSRARWSGLAAPLIKCLPRRIDVFEHVFHFGTRLVGPLPIVAGAIVVGTIAVSESVTTLIMCAHAVFASISSFPSRIFVNVSWAQDFIGFAKIVVFALTHLMTHATFGRTKDPRPASIITRRGSIITRTVEVLTTVLVRASVLEGIAGLVCLVHCQSPLQQTNMGLVKEHSGML